MCNPILLQNNSSLLQRRARREWGCCAWEDFPNHAHAPMKPSTPPLELPRLVMRRASWVALLAWLLVLALGLLRAAADMDQEVVAARTMAAVTARLAQASSWDDQRAINELKQLERGAPLRHLSLSIRDAQGAVIVAPIEPVPPSPPLSWLVALHRALLPSAAPTAVSWPMPRGDGRTWQVTLSTSRESERVEAIENLADVLAIVALGSIAMLLVMAINVRHSFQPMRGLLEAIASLRRGDPTGLRQLPPMPIGELHAIRGALHDLGAALQAAEHERQLLSQKVLTLQEDERRRIARELHDEFGQRLTALRADIAWLQRQTLEPRSATVVAGMAAACASLHDETRQLLTSLQPLGAGDRLTPSSLFKLQGLLEQLVAGWQQGTDRGARVTLRLRTRDRDGSSGPWPDADAAAALAIPHSMVLTLYRISQEALTNVARHAQATRATLQLTLLRAGDAIEIEWQVSDDGVGLDTLEAAQQRGNGLAGIRERVWAFGGDLQCAAAVGAPAVKPGLVLRALFQFKLAPSQELHESAAAP
jgi:two-component system, NarL family, sensor histidine kinase UhpB